MTVIHSVEFARDGGELGGVIPLKSLPRLHDQLASVEGEVRWQLAGGVDKIERPFLRLQVSADIELVCQRCMKTMPFRVDADTVLTQFSDEAGQDEAVAQDEDLEGILFEPELDVEMLVEDEVLLALPYAPRHATCDPTGGHAKASGDAKPNPFAVLAKLKTGKAEDSN
ncbi:MAG: metal-binding protein [Proteobacteria bacterium]|nr:metal-binding protein [Pseudomonadota bacterium]